VDSEKSEGEQRPAKSEPSILKAVPMASDSNASSAARVSLFLTISTVTPSNL
jgi:hypothetical protein